MRLHRSHHFKYPRKLYMATVNSEIEMELMITLAYPFHFYDPVIPKLGLSARSHYRLSKVDTLGLLSAENNGSV